MIQYVPIPISWQIFNLGGTNGFGSDHVRASKIEKRMRHILDQWKDTPYNTKFATPGVGIYCSAFVCRVLDELYRIWPADLPIIPADVGFHSRKGAVAGLRWFRRRYPASYRIIGGETQPGDVFIVGPKGGGPGHAMIVGPQENTLWHASSTGVCYTGFMLPDNLKVYAIYRFKDREAWL